MKKRYIQADAIKAQLFINAFLYGKHTYHKELGTYHSEGCRGGHLELMRLYYKMSTRKRVLKKELLEKLLHARHKVASRYLLESSKTGYMEVFDHDIRTVETL